MFIAVLGSTNETTSQEYNLPWLLSSPLDSFTETLPTRFLDVWDTFFPNIFGVPGTEAVTAKVKHIIKARFTNQMCNSL